MSGVRVAERPDADFWAGSLADALRRVDSSAAGLATEDAVRRLAQDGPNRVDVTHRRRGLRLLAAQFTNPIVIILAVATVLSMALGDLTDGVIILVIIAASGALGFWQEHSAGQAVENLLARVQSRSEVRRDGGEVSVPVDEIVTGDVVVLRAGDIVPADCRVMESHNLQIDEAALTGESFPVEKTPAEVAADAPLAQRRNALFMGTHVASGTGAAVVVQTGIATQFAAIYRQLATRDITTSFEHGMTRFGLLLVRAMTVLVTAIFVVNLILGRPVIDSLLFSLALAVGLTPQLLPAIVAVSLSAGARRMAARRVIVKRLDAIEDFGAMTVLCTDKTGTLTAGAVRLDGAVDPDGTSSAGVLRLAQLNAGLQSGFGNPIDDAILTAAPPMAGAACLAEVPYDFQRKRLSVLVDDETPILITKGALDAVLDVCSSARTASGVTDLTGVRAAVEERFRQLSAGGFRVLGIATKAVPGRRDATAEDERDMTLEGLLTFHDPIKPGAAAAIAELAGLGVSTRLITGDNRLAAAKIAADVGLIGDVLTGAELDRLDDVALAARVAQHQVFAEVEPLHKERIVRALRAGGAVVGFLGDGINDAPALHAADIGISVDSAVDVAKQAAAIVLLDKGLGVVADGVRLGRQTFANTLKYVRVTVSANFGNMLSVAVAAVFLPFLPLLPRQILLLNFLTDIPATTIATDSVDPEAVRTPGRWDTRAIGRFMIIFGLLSTAFDLATFAVLRLGFDAPAAVFRTGWFVESAATELAVLLILRTARPFLRSRPSRPLLLTTAAVAVVVLALPYVAWLAQPLGLAPLPGPILVTLAGLTIGYIAANETVKRFINIDAP